MRPPRACRMCGNTARMSWMLAVRFVARMASTCSSVSSSAAPKTPYPALLIATSIRPRSATVRSTAARRAAVSRTSSTSIAEVGVLLGEVGDRFGFADGADDVVTAVEELFGEVATETTADAGDQPDALCHGSLSLLPAAISLIALSPLRGADDGVPQRLRPRHRHPVPRRLRVLRAAGDDRGRGATRGIRTAGTVAHAGHRHREGHTVRP